MSNLSISLVRLRSYPMAHSRLLLAVLLLALAFFTNVASAQHQGPAPNCGDSCGGGTQPPGTGGGALQTWTSTSNQRGLGSMTIAARRAGKSTTIEGSQSYTYAVPLFD